jgi:hypothetical protein
VVAYFGLLVLLAVLGEAVKREQFERMTAQQVRHNASSEGSVQRGKSLYFERPWQQTLDAMDDANVRTVGELNAAQVRTLYEAISGL